MSILPDIISGGMQTQVYRVKSKKYIREPPSAPLEGLSLLNSRLPTVSAKRQIGLREELQQIKGNYENCCFKKGRRRLKSEHQARLKMEQYNWNKWLNKRNGKATSRLTKREFKVFWTWYSARREINCVQDEELGGIRLDRLAHDFVKINLFEHLPDAITFLKGVDTDNSGYISFSELMEALGNTSNSSQVDCIRQFVSSLTEKEDAKKEAAKAESLKKRVFKRSQTTLVLSSNKTELPIIGGGDATLKRMNSC